MIPKGLAGFIPIVISMPVMPKMAILLDDDIVNCSTWTMWSERANVPFIAMRTAEELFSLLPTLEKQSEIYIDFELLNDSNGATVAKQVFDRGFHNIYLTTGYSKESFPEMPWIKDIIGKHCPWKQVRSLDLR